MLGLIYSFLAIGISSLIFPENIGLVSVFFVSIALMPTIDKILGMSELTLGRTKEVKSKTIGVHFTEFFFRSQKLSLRNLIEDHKEIISAYTFSFFGIFFAFALIGLMLPQEFLSTLLGPQFAFIISPTGQAFSFSAEFFWSILLNNLGVLVVCFAIALIFQYGDSFIIAWNASVWGIAFALQAKQFVLISGQTPLVQFFLIMIVVFPHLIAEALSYFTAAVSGGLISNALAEEKLFSPRFMEILVQAVILFFVALFIIVLAGLLETTIPNYFSWILY